MLNACFLVFVCLFVCPWRWVNLIYNERTLSLVGPTSDASNKPTELLKVKFQSFYNIVLTTLIGIMKIAPIKIHITILS